jgi:hypothetical protein
MKTRTTAILVLIFLGLAGYVYLVELRHASPPEPSAAAPATLWELPADQIVALTVRGNDQETRLVRSAAGEWMLEAPTAELADQGRVRQVLDRLAGLTPTRVLTETLSPLEDYGLDRPALEVTLQLADGRSEALDIGLPNPQGTAHYAQLHGSEAIYLLSDWQVRSLQDLLKWPPIQPTPTPAGTESPTPEPGAASTPIPDS